MKIVGVSGCPTGIAHTFMAAEGLENAAKKQNIEIKIETNGTNIENELTAKEIKDADYVIIASGKEIDKKRFVGKKLLELPISQVVKDPEKALERLSSEATVYAGKEEAQTEGKAEFNLVGNLNGVYKHLMAGVSEMLPFVIVGGIFIAISFAFGIDSANPDSDTYKSISEMFSASGGSILFAFMLPVLGGGIAKSIVKEKNGNNMAAYAVGMLSGGLAVYTGAGFLGAMLGGFFAGYIVNTVEKINVPKSLTAIKTILITPILAAAVTSFVMFYIVGVPISWVLDQLTIFLESLTGSNVILLGALFGFMMAIDMGGPLNKTVSVFSIGLMSSGVYEPIAACMAAGMVPPLGIALSTIVSKNKYSKLERESGKVNWILGASYITEGAIPFAVADPKAVIPSIVLGGMTAGALSMFFEAASMAPHGGVWVMFIPNVITNLGGYAIAIAAGTIVTALALAVLKKGKDVI